MGRGRPSHATKAAAALERAIELLGDVKAKGEQLKELETVYQLLLTVRSETELGEQAA
jgi:hypothetical protein